VEAPQPLYCSLIWTAKYSNPQPFSHTCSSFDSIYMVEEVGYKLMKMMDEMVTCMISSAVATP